MRLPPSKEYTGICCREAYSKPVLISKRRPPLYYLTGRKTEKTEPLPGSEDTLI